MLSFVTNLVFLVTGSYLIYQYGSDFYTALGSWNWPQVQVTVTKSDIAEVRTTDFGSPVARFVPEVSYEYFVNNNYYKGTHITVNPILSNTTQEARDSLSGYGVGASLTARYDPSNPKVSALRPGVHLYDTLPVLEAFFLLFFSLNYFTHLLGFRAGHIPNTQRY
jgi:hypothetical protein